MGRPKGSKNGERPGLLYRRIYHCWKDMNRRCQDPNRPPYNDYGGRGIEVCPEWHSFWDFKLWAELNGYEENLTLERIDVNGPYSPNNCKWIPLEDQALNTRRSKRLSAFGETKSMAAWSKDNRCIVSYYTFRSRVRYGWKIELALTVPADPTNEKRINHA